ncbi:MAG TPA: AAA family ATPase [Thermoanaerobaculia bacterium]|nr:AAA family ATPase [Thermoanaerobaculia bacterium]
MIRRIEARRYRCLLDVRQEVGHFEILIGPNGSGKSAFLDVVDLIGDILRQGVADAVRRRTPNFHDLIWKGEGESFELAVELEIPYELKRPSTQEYDRARYEIVVGLRDQEIVVHRDELWLVPARPTIVAEHASPSPSASWRSIVTREKSGKDYFTSEVGTLSVPFRFGRERLALSNLPEDEEQFPIATWVKRALGHGTQKLVLESAALREPSPPGLGRTMAPNGANLPRVIDNLCREDQRLYPHWLGHIRSVLPDMVNLHVVERPEDRYVYFVVELESGLRLPSWSLSDGALRFMALTILAYSERSHRLYLIEEVENGIHPREVEGVFDSLSTTYDAQILCTTSSPSFVSLAAPKLLLCFTLDEQGAAQVVRGSEHPNLRNWRKSDDLATLFAAGVLDG